MLTNADQGLPVVDSDPAGRPSDHGLGVVLRHHWFMGRLSSVNTYGHTGFTGTSRLVAAPQAGPPTSTPYASPSSTSSPAPCDSVTRPSHAATAWRIPCLGRRLCP